MSGILTTVSDTLGRVGGNVQNATDNVFPPEKRAETLKSLRIFAENNPKLAGFLAAQIAFTGLPLLLFLTFSVTIFIFSLITVLLIGLIASLLFTIFMAGLALVVFLPTAFFTTFAATFLFLWGMGAYYVFQRFVGGDAPTAQHSAIGDKITSLKGGERNWLTEWENKKQEDAKIVQERPSSLGETEQNADMNGKTSVSSEDSGNSTSIGIPLNTTTPSEKRTNGAQKQSQDLSYPEKSTGYGNF